MPIDEALDDLKPGIATPQVKESQDVISLIPRCQKILGDFMHKYTMISSPKNFLYSFGPFVVSFYPEYSNGPVHKICLINRMEGKFWMDLLLSMHLDQTDLAKDVPPILDFNDKKIRALVPGMAGIASEIVQPLASPYALVLGVAPTHRPLLAAAIDYAVQQNELPEKMDHYDSIFSMVPDITHIKKVADEYHITNLKPALIALDSLLEEYKIKWR